MAIPENFCNAGGAHDRAFVFDGLVFQSAKGGSVIGPIARDLSNQCSPNELVVFSFHATQKEVSNVLLLYPCELFNCRLADIWIFIVFGVFFQPRYSFRVPPPIHCDLLNDSAQDCPAFPLYGELIFEPRQHVRVGMPQFDELLDCRSVSIPFLNETEGISNIFTRD